jgi:hypothetical protein
MPIYDKGNARWHVVAHVKGCRLDRVVRGPRERAEFVEKQLLAGLGVDEYRRKHSQQGVIYFVEAAAVSMIKVGWAEDLEQRLVSLRVNCPVDVSVRGTIAGTRTLERIVHGHLATERHHGEWFHTTHKTLHIVDRLIAGEHPAAVLLAAQSVS